MANLGSEFYEAEVGCVARTQHPVHTHVGVCGVGVCV